MSIDLEKLEERLKEMEKAFQWANSTNGENEYFGPTFEIAHGDVVRMIQDAKNEVRVPSEMKKEPSQSCDCCGGPVGNDGMWTR